MEERDMEKNTLKYKRCILMKVEIVCQKLKTVLMYKINDTNKIFCTQIARPNFR